MKKMKKNNKMIFGIMMAVVMMMGLVACGKDGSSDTTPTTTEATTVEVTTEAVETTTDEVVEGNSANDTEATTEATTEEVVEAKYSKSTIGQDVTGSIKIYTYVANGQSDNIVVYSGKGKGNFKFSGVEDIGIKSNEFDDHITFTNDANTMALKYYWDVEPTNNTLIESDDSDYAMMLTNGQFKYYYTDYNDESNVSQWFVDIQVIDDGEVQNIIDEYDAQTSK